jgi:hypothetical protein
MPVEAIRVVGVYATRWTHEGELAIGPERFFELGKLEEYYALFADQLPQVLAHERLAAEELSVEAGGAETWLFALPSDQVVAAIALEFSGPHPNVEPARTVAVLEACAYGNLRVRGEPID